MTAGEQRSAALRIEYDGTPFRGWSRQPGFPSVEEALREAFAAVSLDLLDMRCAGRTDAGVHATAQVVSSRYTGSIPPERLAAALNTRLHSAVSVLASTACPADFDARADATSRAYEYRVLTRMPRSPLRAARALHHPRPLDLDLLRAAADSVLGQHDFTAFTPSETSHVYFHRTVLESRWEQRDDELVYCIRANAFLRHMVRIIVGVMLSVGRGDWSIGELEALLAGGQRSDAHNTAPPHALCLVDVRYGEPLPQSPAG